MRVSTKILLITVPVACFGIGCALFHRGFDRSPLSEQDMQTSFSQTVVQTEPSAEGVPSPDGERNSEVVLNKTLIETIEKDDVKTVEEALDRGLDLEKGIPVETYYNCSPLFIAARNNSLKVARLLISKGATVDSLSPSQAPLWGAAIANHPEMVRFLVEKGADVNRRSDVGAGDDATPLEEALFNDSCEIADILLQHNVSPNGVRYGKGR